jgi:hypothetical protein
MRPVTGRKAILLMSSGLDTFSKSSLDDALKACSTSETPIYAIDLGASLREAGGVYGISGLMGRIDWKRAEYNLGEIATAAGGRVYSGGSTLDLTAKYDDLMGNPPAAICNHLPAVHQCRHFGTAHLFFCFPIATSSSWLVKRSEKPNGAAYASRQPSSPESENSRD